MGQLLSAFDSEFVKIDQRSRELLAQLDDQTLFARPNALSTGLFPASCGEYLLRSAAMVEKTFGGITTRLWDDPFEWTLPEALYDRNSITQYLDEVEETRQRGFAFFTSDADLTRAIPAPSRLTPLIEILLDTVVTASHFQGRAFALFQSFSVGRLPRL